MAIDEADKLIGLAEAAEILNLHPATVRKLVVRGDLVGYKFGSGEKSALRVYKADVYLFIENSKVDPDDYDKNGYLQEWKK